MLLDKTAGDIQDEITVGTDDVVRGTSKYISDWTSQGFDMSKGHNFVSLHMKAATGSSLVVECVPSQGTTTPSFTDDDVIMQINSSTTGIKVTSTTGDVSVSAIYAIDVTLGTE